MSTWQICGVGLCCAAVLLLLRQAGTPLLPAARVAASLLLLGLAAGMLAPILLRVERLLALDGAADYADHLLKGTGIALCCEVCAMLCRDCGEAGVADCVTLVGRLEILLLCLPLVDEVMALAAALLAL